MPTFSPELIKEIISYFKQVYNKDINEEEADQYLDSLAALFESYRDFLQKRDQDK